LNPSRLCPPKPRIGTSPPGTRPFPDHSSNTHPCGRANVSPPGTDSRLSAASGARPCVRRRVTRLVRAVPEVCECRGTSGPRRARSGGWRLRRGSAWAGSRVCGPVTSIWPAPRPAMFTRRDAGRACHGHRGRAGERGARRGCSVRFAVHFRAVRCRSDRPSRPREGHPGPRRWWRRRESNPRPGAAARQASTCVVRSWISPLGRLRTAGVGTSLGDVSPVRPEARLSGQPAVVAPPGPRALPGGTAAYWLGSKSIVVGK